MNTHSHIYIKNMVCSRCIMTVEQILKRLNIPIHDVALGKAELCNELNKEQKAELSNELEHYGFELIEGRKNQIIDRIKKVIQKYLKEVENEEKHRLNLSDFISNALNYEYSYLSDLFSSVE